MSKHTPGPWETGRAAWDEEGDVMYSLHGIKEATAADARLIAAAPDLVEALTNLANEVLGLGGFGPEIRKLIGDEIWEAIGQRMQEAYGAIAKSEGKR